MPVAINRLSKEETPLTFFTLLACYFYCRAKQADDTTSTRRWYDLSAMAFGLSFASQYMAQLFGAESPKTAVVDEVAVLPRERVVVRKYPETRVETVVSRSRKPRKRTVQKRRRKK